MIKVINKIKIYEIDGESFPGSLFFVESHYKDTKKIDIELNGVKYTVLASDLTAAIENALNVNR